MSQVAMQGYNRKSLKHKHILFQRRVSMIDRIGSACALDL